MGFVPVVDANSLMEAVLAEVGRAFDAQGADASEIVIITGTSAERDWFYNLAPTDFTFGRWEDRSEILVACETIKRAKGIEANYVILATLNQEIRNNEMYVGASRARTNLVIVGLENFAERFKISRYPKPS